MNLKLKISIFEAFYVVYMLRYFKTKYSISYPFKSENDTLNEWLKHPIGTSETSESKICKFGQVGSFYLALFYGFRLLLLKQKYINQEIYLSLNRLVFFIIISVSLINLNAFVYLLPIFILEFMYFIN